MAERFELRRTPEEISGGLKRVASLEVRRRRGNPHARGTAGDFMSLGEHFSESELETWGDHRYREGIIATIRWLSGKNNEVTDINVRDAFHWTSSSEDLVEIMTGKDERGQL